MKLVPLVALVFLLQSPLPPPAPADFARWERLAAAGERGGLSPDGRWIAYAINRTNGENEPVSYTHLTLPTILRV